MQKKYARIVEKILAALPERDRQAILRFYLHREPADVVCREAGLTGAEFRVIRMRAMASFLLAARQDATLNDKAELNDKAKVNHKAKLNDKA